MKLFFSSRRHLPGPLLSSGAPFESSFAAFLQSPDAFLAVATDGQRVTGYVLGFDHHAFYANGRVSWMEEIIVAKELRRRGIGRQLMQSFEQWASERQSRLVGLATRRAAPFYRGSMR